MIEAAKDVIRADRARGLTLEEVARIHFCSREYVRLICKQKPDEAKRAREIAAGLILDERSYPAEQVVLPSAVVETIVRFYKKSDRRRLEDAELQARIKAEAPNYSAIARKYGITKSAVIRIRTNAPPPKIAGFKRWDREKRAEAMRKAWARRSAAERTAIAARAWITKRSKVTST